MDRPRDWPYLAMIGALVVAVFAFTAYIVAAPIFHDNNDTWTPATVAPAVPYTEEP